MRSLPKIIDKPPASSKAVHEYHLMLLKFKEKVVILGRFQ